MTYLDSTHRMARPDGKAITCAAVATVKLPADAVREGVGCTLKAGATGANIADAGHDGR
jgi:hypothetical protein